MLELGVIIGLLVGILILLGLTYLHVNPVAVRELKKVLPKSRGTVVYPLSETALERKAMLERAKKLKRDLPIEEVL